MAPRYSQKRIFHIASVRHIEFEKFRFLSNFHVRNGNLYLCTKFDQNRIIHGWDMEIKLFSKWRPSAILNFRELLFWSCDLYWHVILYFWSKFRINLSIWRRDIAKNDFQYGVRLPSLIFKISIFLTNLHARNGNLYLFTEFDRNRTIHGWDMEIKLLSKWRSSAILNFRKLPFWSWVLYWHVIPYFWSKFRINRSIWRRDIAKKRFSIWRPSAIFSLQNFDFLLNVHHGNWNVHKCTKFDRNRIMLGWDMEIMLFSKWRPSAILSFLKIAVLVTWPILACDSSSENDFQYGVRPPSWICYDVIILHPKTVFYVPNFVLNFHDLLFRNFWNILYFVFQHFGLKLPISGFILTIFGEK